jgi:hypothetical protein
MKRPRTLLPLVPLAHRLPLAPPAEQFSAAANGLSSLQAILSHGPPDAALEGLYEAERRRVGKGPYRSAPSQQPAPVLPSVRRERGWE